jgi:hypothetical protein
MGRNTSRSGITTTAVPEKLISVSESTVHKKSTTVPATTTPSAKAKCMKELTSVSEARFVGNHYLLPQSAHCEAIFSDELCGKGNRTNTEFAHAFTGPVYANDLRSSSASEVTHSLEDRLHQ